MAQSKQRDRGALTALALALATIVLVVWLTHPVDNSSGNADVDENYQSTTVTGTSPWMDTYAQWLMAVFSAAATFISIWAVVLLKKTLVATRDAVRSADDAVLETRRIGEAQVRAYLSDDGVEFDWEETRNGSRVSQIEFAWKNFGQSPARSCGLMMLRHLVEPTQMDKPIPQSIGAKHEQDLGTVTLPSGSRALSGGDVGLTVEETRKWLRGEIGLVLHGVAAYRDVFNQIRKTEVCFSAHHVEQTDGGKVRFRLYPHHNKAD